MSGLVRIDELSGYVRAYENGRDRRGRVGAIEVLLVVGASPKRLGWPIAGCPRDS